MTSSLHVSWDTTTASAEFRKECAPVQVAARAPVELYLLWGVLMPGQVQCWEL